MGADTSALRTALEEVAERLGSPARETILCENRGKHLHELRWLVDQRPASVLDVGGGLGVVLLALRPLLGPDARLVLLDRLDEYDESNRMGPAERALQLLAERQVEVCRRDFWPDPDLPFDGGTFEAVTLFSVLEHLPGSPLPLLAEIRRALHPGRGVLHLGGPNAGALMRRLKLAAGRHPYMPYELWLEASYHGHFREYTPGEYQDMLERSGFDLLERRLLAEPTRTRAAAAYHRGRHRRLSATSLALNALAAVDAALPRLRPMVYCRARPVG